MCITANKFTEQGFEVEQVHHNHKRPFVEVTSIPVGLRIKANTAQLTEQFNGKTRVLRVGQWLGCNVAVIESTH